MLSMPRLILELLIYQTCYFLSIIYLMQRPLLSPFQKAAILCIDGVGEWSTTTAWIGNGNEIKPLWELKFPHSLGLLYSAFTYFCGFKVNSGEYKLIGLAH